LLALIGLPGLIIVGMGVDALAKQVLPSWINIEEAMAEFGKWPWPLGVLIIGVGPGIGEELWCRGFLGRGLVGRYGFLGVLLTSFLFGVIHVEPRQAVAAFVMGIFLHGSYLASRSLLVPMLLHMGNNSLGILSMHIPSLKALSMPPEQVPLLIYGGGTLLTAAVVWAFFQSRARLKDISQTRLDTSIVAAIPDYSVRAQPITDDAGETVSTWRAALAGVEFPPEGTATSVCHPWPHWTSWILVATALVLFTGSIFFAKYI